MPSIDVVIPAFGDASRLNRLLGRLDAESESAAGRAALTVIVSDDGSPSPLETAIDRSQFPHLELLVTRGENGGPGAARNRGLAQSSAEWVAFLDADTVPEVGWLKVVHSLISQADEVDAFEGSVAIPNEGASPFAHATAIETDVAHGGANILYRRDSLLSIGGFSEDYYDRSRKFHFREDNDLYFRAVDAGLRVERAIELVALHPPLDASFVTPIRLARRYYFDPLLDRRHSARFRELNLARTVGPVSLRAARHGAAVGHVGAALVLAAGVGVRDRRVAALGGVGFAASWAANVMAMSWGKQVRARDLPGLAVAALGTAWTYTWHYYRGVIAFDHRPRLR